MAGQVRTLCMRRLPASTLVPADNRFTRAVGAGTKNWVNMRKNFYENRLRMYTRKIAVEGILRCDIEIS